MLWALAVLSGVFGLVVGSFLNVVIHRVPKGESIVSPPSRCPGCGSRIAAYDNVPVLSWLMLRGKCRHCGEAISARYPLIEAANALLWAGLALRLGFDPALPAFLVLAAGLVALSAIDLETFRLPTPIVYTLLVAGIVLLAGAAVAERDLRSAVEAGAGSLLAFGLLLVIHLVSPKGMGFGDVRLASVLGLYLGYIELPMVAVGLFFGFLLASVIGIGLIGFRRRTRKDRIPFGPFLALGFLVAVFVGEPILNLYLAR